MVYVCDRQNNRIQVFQKDGKFVKEAFVSKDDDRRRIGVGRGVLAGSEGAVRRRRPRQDGLRCWTAPRSRPIGRFGDGGRYPGLFYGVGSVAVDSKGNVYTGETYDGKRVQKFVKK